MRIRVRTAAPSAPAALLPVSPESLARGGFRYLSDYGRCAFGGDDLVGTGAATLSRVAL